MSLNVCGTPALTNVRNGFEKIKPIPLKQEVIVPKKDRVKMTAMGSDWFDRDTKNPG